jgi:hypothetical protein
MRFCLIFVQLWFRSGPGSSVGIATGYGLDGPGVEFRWGARFSAPVQTGPGAHPASCTMGTRSFPGVKSGLGVTLTPHPLPVPWSWRVGLYLYSPYGPFGLYRAPVPVRGCTVPFTFYGFVDLPTGCFYLFFFYSLVSHTRKRWWRKLRETLHLKKLEMPFK